MIPTRRRQPIDESATTIRAIADADLTVVVLDGSEPLTVEDKEVLVEISALPHLIAVNKADLDSFRLNGLVNNSSAPVISVVVMTPDAT